MFVTWILDYRVKCLQCFSLSVAFKYYTILIKPVTNALAYLAGLLFRQDKLVRLFLVVCIPGIG